MIVITAPKADTYGQYARASLLADYIELLALKGQRVRRTTVAAFLTHNDWDLDLIRLPETGGLDGGDRFDGESMNLSAQQDEAADVASSVFWQMAERREMLAERYPFEISDDAVSLSAGVESEASAYVAVLALTIAHAFGVDLMHRPEEMFERIVTRALRARGLSSTCLAAHRRRVGNFEAALRSACEEVGLKAAPDAAPGLVNAHDEGVDVLCHIGWEESLRPGTWAFIGQVTVGRSDSWIRKIREPSPNQWKRLAGTGVRPSPFLAVPHHVERPTMEWLTTRGDAIVLDRLRLVRFKDEIEADEREIIRAVVEAEVEPLAG